MRSKCNRCIKGNFRHRQTLMILPISTNWEVRQHTGVRQEVHQMEIPKGPTPALPCVSLMGHLNIRVMSQTAQPPSKIYYPARQKRPTGRTRSLQPREKLSKTSRKKTKRRKRKRTKVLNWYIPTMISAQRRRWHKCPGTHSLPLERKKACQEAQIWQLSPLPQVRRISLCDVAWPQFAIITWN